jgi:hypothetical protein
MQPMDRTIAACYTPVGLIDMQPSMQRWRAGPSRPAVRWKCRVETREMPRCTFPGWTSGAGGRRYGMMPMSWIDPHATYQQRRRSLVVDQ